MAIALRYAARSHVGLVRQSNQDSAYAGPHLLVVADGMGGHAAGDVASSLAIGEMAPLDDESHGPDALEHLARAVSSAHRELLGRVGEEPQLAGMGTTITALLRSGSKLALAHIGDSRAYLLRDGVLVQITRDHTFVQTLVDDGRLTPEEAEQHPQRSVLMRVLSSDFVEEVEPDLSMREARVGDRYLLCSDGLSGVVSFETLRDTLTAGDDPAATAEALIKLALRGGAPDNVTCIIADVIEATDLGDATPAVVGAASLTKPHEPPTSQLNGSAAERAAALTAAPVPVSEPPATTPARPARVLRRLVGGLLVITVVIAGGFAAWQWIQHQYFVGARDDSVAIFRGLPESIGPLHLAWIDQTADDVKVADLPVFAQEKVRNGIPAASHDEAGKIVENLRQQAADCRAAASAGTSADASPTPTGSPTDPGTASPSPASNGVLTPVPPSPAAQSPVPPATPTALSTVGSPVIAVNPQATTTSIPSVSASPVGAGCGGLAP